MKKNIIFILLVILLIFLTILVKTNLIVNFDNYVYQLVTHDMDSRITILFKFITNLADWKIITLFCILSLLLIKDKWIGIVISINSINSTIINKILKSIFVRPRPDVLKLIRQSGYSFPSGHAMASMSFYGSLIYLIYKSNFNRNIKIIFIIILSIVLLLIGISRVYLGVHYASDILAGYLTSIIYMSIFIKYYNNIKAKK